MTTSISFQFDVGQKVIIPGLNNSVGYVLSLWYSDRGAKYEVAFYCASERTVEYFLGVELENENFKNNIGYANINKKCYNEGGG